MNARQKRVSGSIDHALACLSTKSFQLPRLAPLRRQLADKNREIEALDVVQHTDSIRTRGIEKVDGLRAELRTRHLLPISREGNRLLKGMPGIREALRVPHKRAKDDELLDASDRILEAAEVHVAVFRKALFHRDFIKRARRATDALAKEHAIRVNRPSIRGSRATHDLKGVLASAREIVRSIDSVVEAEFFGDRTTLHAWRLAKRIPKQVGRPKKRPKKRPPPDSATDDQPPA